MPFPTALSAACRQQRASVLGMHAQQELLRLERNIQTWHAGQPHVGQPHPAGPPGWLQPSLPQSLLPRPPLQPPQPQLPPQPSAMHSSATSHLDGDELAWQRAIEAAEERAEAAERTASAMLSEAEMAEVEIVQLRRLVAGGVEERERMRAEIDASKGARTVRQPAVHGLKWRGEAPPPAAAAGRAVGTAAAGGLERPASHRDAALQSAVAEREAAAEAAAEIVQLRGEIVHLRRLVSSGAEERQRMVEERGRWEAQRREERAEEEAAGQRLWQAMQQRGPAAHGEGAWRGGGGGGGGGGGASGGGGAAEAELAQLRERLWESEAQLGHAAAAAAQLVLQARASEARVAQLEQRLAESARLERSWRHRVEEQAARHDLDLEARRGAAGDRSRQGFGGQTPLSQLLAENYHERRR